MFFNILIFSLQIKLKTGKEYCDVMENIFECNMDEVLYKWKWSDLHLQMYGGWSYTCATKKQQVPNFGCQTIMSLTENCSS